MTIPNSIQLRTAFARTNNLLDAVESFWNITEAAGSTAKQAQLDWESKIEAEGLEKLIEYLNRREFGQDFHQVQLDFTNGAWGLVSYMEHLDNFNISYTIEATPTISDFTAALGISATLLHDLLETRQLLEGALVFSNGGAGMLPYLPLVDPCTYATVATEAQIAESYESVESFLNSGWQTKEKIGDQWLLTRALDKVTAHEYFQAVNPQHRELARIVKPGLAEYRGDNTVDAEERAAYSREPKILRPVGYNRENQTRIYTAVLEKPGDHIPGWQIDVLYRQLSEGQLDSDRPLKEAIIIFLDHEMAESEKRPLLDIGAKVAVHDDSERGYSLVDP